MVDYKVVIIAPTCFYYQVPIFRALAAHPQLDLTVYFCSGEAITGEDIVRKFNSSGSWGTESELLDGYKYKLLKNYSPAPSYVNWPLGLINLGVWSEIRKDRPDAVILMSWMNPTWWLTILCCTLLKVPYMWMTDQNIEVEPLKPKWKTWPKKLFLGNGVFRMASGFLCAGTANQLLYQYYGVPEEKLFPFAFSWAHEELLECSEELMSQRHQLRDEYGLPQESYVVLYCGRLSQEKSVVGLLKAYHRVNAKDKALVFVGDGPLRQQLEKYIDQIKIDSVHFFGFQNRQEAPKFYALADVLVLPSYRETWGMVVNEAMCFGLPVIVSDQVGASKDLVLDGYNGLSFPEGNVEALSSRIEQLAEMSEAERQTMGSRSLELIKKWSQRDLAASLVQYMDRIYVDKKPEKGMKVRSG